jgi:predicted DNA-binding transcriptional regulator AlpA
MSRSPSTDPLLTVEEVANWLQVSPRTVWRWSASGLLPPPVHPHRHSTRWRADDLRRFVDRLAQGRPATSAT